MISYILNGFMLIVIFWMKLDFSFIIYVYKWIDLL